MDNKGQIRRWPLFLMSGLLGLMILLYLGLWGDPSAIPPVIINTPAMEFSGFEMYTGRSISLSQMKGKVVFLNFWASWCRECKLEHDSLLDLKKRYADRPDFIFLGVNYQDKENLAKAYLEEHGNNYEHIQDLHGRISIDYGVYGIPETFLIDRHGMIRHKHIGPIVGETYANLIETWIEPLLKESE